MKTLDIIETTKAFVKSELANAEGGHDWFHTERVFKNALLISEKENVDELTVSLAALLHDIADPKFYNGDETLGPKTARKFLFDNNIDSQIIEHVVAIIENMSFKNAFDSGQKFTSLEMKVVQDADRLDAIGAIGIARCFNYGGYRNRALYDPKIAPKLNMTKNDYKSSEAPTINHFYEKLLLLKDKMNTKTGTQIAAERHKYMEGFLKQFYAECVGKS
jgi:uncharacterized protein